MKKTIAMIFLFSVLMVPALRAQTATAPTTGFRADFLQQLDDVQQKILDLAGAVPAEKYSWRPAEGVRSISEVYVHIAGANFLFPTFAGVNPPAGISQDLEKTVTEKAKVIELLKQSFDHIRQAVVKTTDADLEKKVKFFGGDSTIRYVYFVAALHMHEHLGQSIAYARENGVIPPWTAAEMKSQK